MAKVEESAAHKHACAESANYEYQIRMTYPSFQIHPRPTDSSNDLDRDVFFREYFCRNRSSKVSGLGVDDCRLFCWKDCAVYSIGTKSVSSDHIDILQPVWREWYPHRAMDKDLECQSFFMKHMRFLGATKDLQEIYTFHLTLCEKLRDLEKDMPYALPRLSQKKARPPTYAEYRLRRTLMDVFIVLEKEWREHGVLLVFNSEDAAQRHGCQLSRDVQKYTGPLIDAVLDGYDLVDDQLVTPHLVFQCQLELAMQIVMCVDSDRKVRRARYECESMIQQFGQGEDEGVVICLGQHRKPAYSIALSE